MRKRIPTIIESIDELHRLLKAEKDVQRHQRVELVYLLRSGQARTRQIFLHEFAVTDPASLLVLVLDNGSAHKAAMLTIPANVHLLFLPPYAPELNPIERLWRAMKDTLAEAGEPPETLEALSGQVATLIKDLTPPEIQSLTSYHYFVQAA